MLVCICSTYCHLESTRDLDIIYEVVCDFVGVFYGLLLFLLRTAQCSETRSANLLCTFENSRWCAVAPGLIALSVLVNHARSCARPDAEQFAPASLGISMK